VSRGGGRARGYVLAEALVSAALASLAGGLAVTLLVWSAASVDRAQSAEGAIRVLDRLYEESRLATPAALGRPASGFIGRYQWIRAPGRSLGDAPGLADDLRFAYSPVPVRFVVQWRAGGRTERRQLQAIVRPAGQEPAP
jgi:type II secretory pathway pseudopilin PulG